MPANLIDDGDRIWLIDYEYSGNNDACFELGNIAAEAHLGEDGLVALVTGYTGGRGQAKSPEPRLLGLAGMYGWTLWGAIQHAASLIQFDFWSWAMERLEGAAAGFTASSFGGGWPAEAVQLPDSDHATEPSQHRGSCQHDG